jgi:hypothetical protein
MWLYLIGGTGLIVVAGFLVYRFSNWIFDEEDRFEP